MHAHRGLQCQVACAESKARAEGLDRLDSEWSGWLNELYDTGMRIERRPTGLPDLHGFGAYERAVEEWWTEAWIARIASWEGLYQNQKRAAVRRLIADPAMLADARAHIGACASTVFTEQATVHLISATGAEVMMKEQPGLRWILVFDDDGQIVDSFLGARMGKYEHEGKFPPLHIVLAVMPVIEQFARCNAMFNWLAGTR